MQWSDVVQRKGDRTMPAVPGAYAGRLQPSFGTGQTRLSPKGKVLIRPKASSAKPTGKRGDAAMASPTKVKRFDKGSLAPRSPSPKARKQNEPAWLRQAKADVA